MRLLFSLYRFMSSVTCSILLILITVGFVATGAIIGSAHDLHTNIAYKNPIFISLLWVFFANIVLAISRRQPLCWRHAPFIITHIGLLMTVGGTLVKEYFAIEGSLHVIEGGGSDRVLLSDSYTIGVWGRDEKGYMTEVMLPIKYGQLAYSKDIKDLKISTSGFHSNSKEQLQLWIKGSYATLAGLPPFPLSTLVADDSADVSLPPSGRLAIFPPSSQEWLCFFIKGAGKQAILREAYLQEASARIIHKPSGYPLYAGPLKGLVTQGIRTPHGTLTADLNISISPLGYVDKGKLTISLTPADPEVERVAMTSYFLIKTSEAPPPSDFVIQVTRTPTLAIIEDLQGNNSLYVIDSVGFIQERCVRAHELGALLAIDHGFGGYGIETHLPPPSPYLGWQERQYALIHQLGVETREALAKGFHLSPALNALADACHAVNKDFVTVWIGFMVAWEHSNRWLYPINTPLPRELEEVFAALDDTKLPNATASWWCGQLFSEFDETHEREQALLTYLKTSGWPFLNELQQPHQSFSDSAPTPSPYPLFSLFTKQLFATARYLPSPKTTKRSDSAPEKARRLSVHLRLQGLHPEYLASAEATCEDISLWRAYLAMKRWRLATQEALGLPIHNDTDKTAVAIRALHPDSPSFLSIRQAYESATRTLPYPPLPEDSDAVASFFLNYVPTRIGPTDAATLRQQEEDLLCADYPIACPITRELHPLSAVGREEDNRPLVSLLLSKGNRQEIISLSYDRFASGLRWPALGGSYLLRFQATPLIIPYHVRLRSARRIPSSDRDPPYAYEADLIITDAKGVSTEMRISRNNVYETADGYRFDLGGVSSPEGLSAQHAEIIITHDPAKYLLTYPGALIASLGGILLFWFRQKKMLTSSEHANR